MARLAFTTGAVEGVVVAETLEQMRAEITRLKQLVAQVDATVAEGEEAQLTALRISPIATPGTDERAPLDRRGVTIFAGPRNDPTHSGVIFQTRRSERSQLAATRDRVGARGDVELAK